MNRKDPHGAEIAKLESEIASMLHQQHLSSMGNGRYYTDGSKARDDAEINKARTMLEVLTKRQQEEE